MKDDPIICPFCKDTVEERPHICKIVVSPETYEKIVEILENPSPPTEAMQKLLAKLDTIE